ncbi:MULTISPECIES: glycosyltransferase [Rhodomicrobium]|uniref:glycosyltransferase family 2 protein n=1 Tax=Rhodomicrobium TaxID=1068 RepID=UPI00148365E8|nr:MULTISPECIES: glycosyltransferase [Rhodomicrobium]
MTGICVVIAAFNAEATIAKAVRSALAQPPVAELFVVDDASGDATASAALSQDDGSGRLKLIRLTQNVGPAAARNMALGESSAPYFCVLDADDYMMAGRIARLMASAPAEWDLIADDIVIVPQRANHAFSVSRDGDTGARTLDLEAFVNGNISRPGRPRAELGFLKPIISRAFIDQHGLAYDEGLRLGEDYALYVQALLCGARFRLVSACGYVAVERHDSLSSRHSAEDLRRIAAFDDAILATHTGLAAPERRALLRHRAATEKKYLHGLMLDRKREKGLRAGLGVLAEHPGALPYILAETARAKRHAMIRRLRPGIGEAPPTPRFLVGFPNTRFCEASGTSEIIEPSVESKTLYSKGF